jgi:hypothetical protein
VTRIIHEDNGIKGLESVLTQVACGAQGRAGQGEPCWGAQETDFPFVKKAVLGALEGCFCIVFFCCIVLYLDSTGIDFVNLLFDTRQRIL